MIRPDPYPEDQVFLTEDLPEGVKVLGGSDSRCPLQGG